MYLDESLGSAKGLAKV